MTRSRRGSSWGPSSPVLARANLVTRHRRYTLPSAVRRSSVSWPGGRRPLVLGLPLMKRIRAFDARVRMPARSECVLSAMSAALSAKSTASVASSVTSAADLASSYGFRSAAKS